MKRKRGNKKGKSKKPPVVVVNEPVQNVVSLNTDDNSGLDDFANYDADFGMEVETPSSTGAVQPEKLASINSDGLINRTTGKLVYGRVKVKIKTSKALDSQRTSSDARTQSDTDKSSPQVGLEKHGIVSEKMEDSANSLLDTSTTVSGNPSKKAGSIKIKSSRGFVSSSMTGCSNSVQAQGEQAHQKEPEFLRRHSRYNEQELNSALEVIKKVMKMDAAEPFNAPVNPIALGIPDYFDVIDTPMDFGTICHNLESGAKYMNSEDVFKDVQYIWENCYKYNNKGDYVVELMKRVKKNFMKYWTAAGLYSEQSQVGVENSQVKDITPSTNVKMQVKGGPVKLKTKKKHGVKRHKDDCLCAICVMMRRRQEREENAQIFEDQMGASNSHQSQELKLEEPSPAGSPYGEDTSSNMDNSVGPDGDADVEEKGEEVKLEGTEQQLYSPLQQQQVEEAEAEIQMKERGEIYELSEPGEKSGEERNREYPIGTVESGGDIHVDGEKELSMQQQGSEAAAIEQQKEKELAEKSRKAEMYENLRRFENPMLLKLCGTLFPDEQESVWRGPRSLIKREDLGRTSSIHAAIASFMK